MFNQIHFHTPNQFQNFPYKSLIIFGAGIQYLPISRAATSVRSAAKSDVLLNASRHKERPIYYHESGRLFYHESERLYYHEWSETLFYYHESGRLFYHESQRLFYYHEWSQNLVSSPLGVMPPIVRFWQVRPPGHFFKQKNNLRLDFPHEKLCQRLPKSSPTLWTRC